MKKKLKLESLRVDTFEAGAAAVAQRGTVHAHASDPYHCASGVWSCLDTCQDTCGMSCWGSCVFTCDCA